MPDRPTSNPEQIIQGAPILHVPDVTATATFYRDVLGFHSDPEGTSDDYTVVWRDNAAIHFARGDSQPTGVELCQWVKDVDGCHREVVDRGAEVSMPLGNRPYGIRDFSVRDPNGITVVFGQDWYEEDSP